MRCAVLLGRFVTGSRLWPLKGRLRRREQAAHRSEATSFCSFHVHRCCCCCYCLGASASGSSLSSSSSQAQTQWRWRRLCTLRNAQFPERDIGAFAIGACQMKTTTNSHVERRLYISIHPSRLVSSYSTRQSLLLITSHRTVLPSCDINRPELIVALQI